MIRPLTDHRKATAQGRLKPFSALDKQRGNRLHPLFENTFRRAKSPDATRRMARFLAMDRLRG